MNKFIIQGEYKQYGKRHDFEREIEAETEKLAKNKLYSLMGSEHKLKRNQIKIKEVKNA